MLRPDREGRARFYGPRECARMTLILRGRRFGFQLEELRQWLLMYEKEGTVAQMKTWIEMADRQLVDLATQKEQLQLAMDELQLLRNETIQDLERKAL